MEIDGPLRSTPRKHRARKLKEPLDVVFLRRSKRLNSNLDGFRSEEAAQEAANNPSIYNVATSDEANVAPYLSIDNIQGMATGFLQIQPEVVFCC